VLAHPSSTGSIPTSGGKEDHVSMGMTGALKLRQIVDNLERIVGVELMCAAQGVEFRQPLAPAKAVAEACTVVREVVARLENDRVLALDIVAMAAAVRAGRFDAWCGDEGTGDWGLRD
jgi:histidine ammonia-lyase